MICKKRIKTEAIADYLINKQNKGKNYKKTIAKSGILINKNDQNIKDTTVAAAAVAAEVISVPSNHFDIKTPKDAVELKK